jgi:mannose-P-dolichol utilization defect protein 1
MSWNIVISESFLTAKPNQNKSIFGFRNDSKKCVTIKDGDPFIVAVTSVPTSNETIAKYLGYVMGIGSVSVFTPIIFHILNAKSSQGLSIETWILNVIGISLAAAYPFKKKYPVNSYIEFVILSIQSIIIVGLLCHFNNQHLYFLSGMALYILAGFTILNKEPNPILMSSMQITAVTICNFATVPQIILSYRTKTSVWSRATAALSIGGNFIRMFTTLKLTKDPLFLFGPFVGALTNGILLLQSYLYSK